MACIGWCVGTRRACWMRRVGVLAGVLGVQVALLAGFSAGAAFGQATVQPPFAASYTLHDLGAPPGVPDQLGGLTLKAGDDSTLLIGGDANESIGALYSIGVTRDAGGHITGFSGTATRFADAAYNDGGVTYGPGGVLFLARWPQNELGQTKPGSIVTDKIVGMGPLGVASSLAAVAFVPPGFPGAGSLKLSSYSGGQWYDASVVPDGTGTYDIVGVTQVAASTLSGGPEGYVYVPPGSSQFSAASMLVCEYSAGKVGAYEIDPDGNPVVATRRDFITGLTGAEGAFIDPVTNDFVFSTFGGGNHVIAVRGFVAPDPEPVVTLDAPADGTATNDATPQLSGTAGTDADHSSIVTVKVYAGSSTSGTLVQTRAASRSAASWSIDASPALSDGTYTAQAEQEDTDTPGNTGLSAAHRFTIDTTAPSVMITSPSGGSSSTDDTPTFAGSAGDAAGDATTVTVRIYSGSAASGTPGTTLTATRSGTGWTVDAGAPLVPGPYTAQAEQADTAGNSGLSAPTTFTIAATGPPTPTPSPTPPPQPPDDDPIGGIGVPASSTMQRLCGVQRKGLCRGLQGNTEFLSPGNAVWDLTARLAGKRAHKSAARTIKLGRTTKRITASGRVKFRIPIRVRTYRKLVREFRRSASGRLVLKVTHIGAGGRRTTQTEKIKLKR